MTDVKGAPTQNGNEGNSNTVRISPTKTLRQRRADAKVAKLAKQAKRAEAEAKSKKAEAIRVLREKAKVEKYNARLAEREARQAAAEAKRKAKAEADEMHRLLTEAKRTSLDVLISKVVRATGEANTSYRIMALRCNDDLGLGWHLLDPKSRVLNDNEKWAYKEAQARGKRIAEEYVKAGYAPKGKYMPMSRIRKYAAEEYDKAMGIVRTGANDRKPLVERVKATLPSLYKHAMEMQNTVEDEVDQRKFAAFATKLGELLNLAGVDLTDLNKKG